MERLDACYFCGTAADAPLREVSITHGAREDDPEASVAVTLCADCERKLQTVLGHVFENVESRRVEDASEVTRDARPEPDDDGSVGSATGRTPSGESVDRIDVSSEEAGATGRRLYDDIPDINEVTPTTSSDGDEQPDDAAGDEAELLEDEEPTVRARATAGDPLDGVSVAEYNRVMRLLQNREFPMARAAFVDLASSAYDLGEDAVEQVLETVIDQGALEDRDGDLVRPGERGGPGS